MNYRHAYHAGNHADVLKHAVLARLMEHLKKKDKPFRVIDAHAGIGLYDLAGLEAGKTGEWEGGIGKLAEPFNAEIEALLGAVVEMSEWVGVDMPIGRALLALVRQRAGMSANG